MMEKFIFIVGRFDGSSYRFANEMCEAKSKKHALILFFNKYQEDVDSGKIVLINIIQF